MTGLAGGQRGRSTRLFVCPAARTAAAAAGEAAELPQSATALLSKFSTVRVSTLQVVKVEFQLCTSLSEALAKL